MKKNEPSISRAIRNFEEGVRKPKPKPNEVLVLRIERLLAAKELWRFGRSALKEIAAHLRECRYKDDERMQLAWSIMLGLIATRNDLRDLPEKQEDGDAWIRWAEENGYG